MCQCANEPVCQCASVPICQCANVPVCQCANEPVCQCASGRNVVNDLVRNFLMNGERSNKKKYAIVLFGCSDVVKG